MKKLSILLLFVSQISFSQSSILDETISKIEISQDTIKSVYDWIADNITYDINKLKKIKKRTTSSKNLNFKTEEEYQEYLLIKVIQQRKGVCEDYSLLFNAIVRQLGYESYIIEGYTKNSSGKVQRSISHTWNVVKNGGWKLYDPTWGAGYVENDKKFVKHYNQEWYNVSSKEMIKTHMPFDPIWQLSNSPINYEDFENDLRIGDSVGIYNYEELIEIHTNKEKKEQMKDQVDRSIAIGDGMWLVVKWRKSMSKNIGIYGITSQQDLLEEANEKVNNSVELFNDYIKAKNKRFRGKKWTFDYAKQNLEAAKEQVEFVLEVYNSIEVEDRAAIYSIKKSIINAERILKRIDEELRYLEELNPS